MAKHQLVVKIDLSGQTAEEELKDAQQLAYRILTEVLYDKDPVMIKLVDNGSLSYTNGPGHLIIPQLCDFREALDAGVSFNVLLKPRA